MYRRSAQGSAAYSSWRTELTENRSHKDMLQSPLESSAVDGERAFDPSKGEPNPWPSHSRYRRSLRPNVNIADVYVGQFHLHDVIVGQSVKHWNALGTAFNFQTPPRWEKRGTVLNTRLMQRIDQNKCFRGKKNDDHEESVDRISMTFFRQ